MRGTERGQATSPFVSGKHAASLTGRATRRALPMPVLQNPSFNPTDNPQLCVRSVFTSKPIASFVSKRPM